jgi:hypothetical protein
MKEGNMSIPSFNTCHNLHCHAAAYNGAAILYFEHRSTFLGKAKM